MVQLVQLISQNKGIQHDKAWYDKKEIDVQGSKMIQGQNLVIGELGVPSSTLTHTIRLQNARRGGLSAKLQGVQLQTDKGADIVWHLFILGSCDSYYEEWIIGTDQQTNDSTHDQTSNSLFFVGTVGYCLYNVKMSQHMSTKHHWAVSQRKADKTQVSSFQALFPQRCSSDQFRRSLFCGLYIYIYTLYAYNMFKIISHWLGESLRKPRKPYTAQTNLAGTIGAFQWVMRPRLSRNVHRSPGVALTSQRSLRFAKLQISAVGLWWGGSYCVKFAANFQIPKVCKVATTQFQNIEPHELSSGMSSVSVGCPFKLQLSATVTLKGRPGICFHSRLDTSLHQLSPGGWSSVSETGLLQKRCKHNHSWCWAIPKYKYINKYIST